MQRTSRLSTTLAIAAFAAFGAACSVQVDSTLALEEGSGMEITVATSPAVPVPLDGGVVMNIDVSIGILDLLFGEINGDVAVGELLFASPGFTILGIPTEELCVIPDPVDPGGGSFTADLYDKTTSFDVTINTRGIVGSPVLSGLLPDGLAFPFALQSTTPMTLGEMLGLITGSGDLTVTQDLDLDTVIPVGAGIPLHVGGQLTLSSADAFPTSPAIDDCIALLAGP